MAETYLSAAGVADDAHASGRDLRDGLVVADVDGVARFMDPRARALLGDLLDVGERIPGLYLRAGTTLLEYAEEDATRRLELRSELGRVDGRQGWTIAVVDVSGRRSPLQEATDMVAAVSHEMRTPLTAITGYASTLRHHWAELDVDRQLEFLKIIERQGTRLARLTSDLLALSKADAGRLDIELDDVVLGRAVAEMLEALRGEVEGVTVIGDPTVRVRVDPIHLEDVLLNFVTNAGKYGRPPITVEIAREGNDGIVRVRDEGDGVPPGFVHRMWRRFARARADERPAGVPGSGLGLAVVDGLVRANGGRVFYEPNEPHGSCFGVAFPLVVHDH